MNHDPFTQPPRVTQRIDAIRTWDFSASTASIFADVVAIGGSASRTEGHPAPVLQCIDVRSGHEIARVFEPSEVAPMDVQSSTPTFASDGSVAIAVYQHDVALTILCADTRGSVQWRETLPEARWPVRHGDSGPKLHLAPVVPLEGGDVICSALYRQGREQRIERRAIRESREVWSVDDWLLAVEGTVVLGAGKPQTRREPKVLRLPPAETWNARDISNGVLRWSIDGTDRTLLGTATGRFAFIDRQPRVEERRGHITEADRAFLAHEIDEERLTAAWEYEARAPYRIVTACIDDGLVLASTPVPHTPVSALVDDRGCVLITRAPDGATVLVTLDRDGTSAREHGIDPPAANAGAEGPAVVARFGSVILVAWERDLDGIDADSGRLLWRIDLPEANHAYAPRMVDRDLARRDVVANEHCLVVRGRDHVTILSTAT